MPLTPFGIFRKSCLPRAFCEELKTAWSVATICRRPPANAFFSASLRCAFIQQSAPALSWGKVHNWTRYLWDTINITFYTTPYMWIILSLTNMRFNLSVSNRFQPLLFLCMRNTEVIETRFWLNAIRNVSIQTLSKLWSHAALQHSTWCLIARRQLQHLAFVHTKTSP